MGTVAAYVPHMSGVPKIPHSLRFTGPAVRVVIDAETHRRCRERMVAMGYRGWEDLLNRLLAEWCAEEVGP